MQLDKEPTAYTVEQLLVLKKNNMLGVNPEYQRGAVWNDTQKKKLIDSIFRGYPLPLIYLHHITRDVAGMRREDLEIIDGRQRLDAIHEFRKGRHALLDPVKDDKKARFPKFIKALPCPWAGCRFAQLSQELQSKFLQTKLFVVRLRTDEENEARGLFIRLQAGLPLNAQERRDAWPGGITDVVLKFAGKADIVKYPGHPFFQKMISSKDRGKARQLCAQAVMSFLSRRKNGQFTDTVSTSERDTPTPRSSLAAA